MLVERRTFHRRLGGSLSGARRVYADDAGNMHEAAAKSAQRHTAGPKHCDAYCRVQVGSSATFGAPLTQPDVTYRNVSPAPEAPAAPARQPAPPKRPRSPVDGGHAEPQNKRPRQEASGAQPSAPGTRPTAMNTARTRPEGDNAPATGSRSAPADAAQPAGPARAAEASESGVTRSAARTVPLDTLNAASSRAVADDVVVKQEDADDAHALGGAAKENAPPGPQDAPGDQGERNRGATSIVGTLKTALDAAVAAADAHLNGLRSNVETRELETARLSKRLARQSAKLRATEQALQQREKDVEAAGARNDAALARAASEVSEARASESATAAQLAEARGQLAEARSQFVRGRLRLAEVTAERDRLAQLVATLQADIARDEAKHEAELKATQDMNALLRAQVGTLQSEAQAARTVASEELRQSELRVQAEIDKRQAAELKIQTEVERRQVAELSAQDLSKKYVRTQLDLLGEINCKPY
ncbi:uncharacterized protein B0H18DRAFT_182502 [Fomitopsis serialis]|uniref:uncharacterized protein n=1 Tax=Fomitopsis serialis TaxID=139415 RepID=UPI002007F36A|nr:uncharacterized protein B0H18DRAFT_182502 [Neoantrodia serialis]KAH9913235.1 hypothetical protein B0H18DRAFT_182502 [Neoantrodia serialis]